MAGPGPKLDGAGMAKMAVLEEALHVMSSVHSHVEKMGVAIKNKQQTQVFVQAIKRQLTPLATKLKMQFGMIADQVSALLLSSTRGSNETTRLRSMREGVAQIKVALEIAVAQTITKHSAEEH
jgi:hypothetical protein